jgi:hypothetical protein
MTGVTHAHQPVRQQVLGDPPPKRSFLMRFAVADARGADMSGRAVVMLVIGGLVVGCGADNSDTIQAPSQEAKARTSPRAPAIVGRWEVLRTCEGMVKAVREVGLGKLAPSVVGDYFPDQNPKQLARKADVCEGAEPQQHSHFFTNDGQFGSLDQNDEQVDDAPYHIVDERTLRLSPEFGDETYRYRIAGGNKLSLEPVIPPRAKREALESPLGFSLALHMAAVAYTGQAWTRVDCAGRC